MLNLSKSKYCKGVQCPKMLWLDKNKPGEATPPDAARLQIFKTGSEVGDLAMGYFGDFAEVKVDFEHRDFTKSIAETQQLLTDGTQVIIEATFDYKNNLCMVDILRVFGKDVEIVEVKSSTGAEKGVYLDDLAYQYYVVSHSGLHVRKASLMFVNNQYVRQGELDVKQLFSIEDLTEKVVAKQFDVQRQISQIQSVVEQADEPTIDIGEHCNKPYDCAFHDYCFRKLPSSPNIFDLRGNHFKSQKKWSAYREGIVTLEQLLNSGIKLSEKTALEVETEVNNLPPTINKKEVKAFVDSLTYPLYFLDFETYNPAIPPFDGTHPYMQIPFQYSLHIQESPDAEPDHKEFLAKEGTDPRRALAERLCTDIPDNVCVLTYNMSFEKTRIEELAQSFPDLKPHLMKIHSNIQDLEIPFKKRHYYCRDFRGKSSIKYVLPALCPGDPELDYKSLPGIHNGTEAMNVFQDLHTKPQEEIDRLRKALLAYCRLDTLAIVKVLGVLRKAVS